MSAFLSGPRPTRRIDHSADRPSSTPSKVGPPPRPSSTHQEPIGKVLSVSFKHRLTGKIVDDEALCGTYDTVGENHSRPVYAKRRDKATSTPEVHIYFWDVAGSAQDADEGGWWFGRKIGGEAVWARHPEASEVPPRSGWWVAGEEGSQLDMVVAACSMPHAEEDVPAPWMAVPHNGSVYYWNEDTGESIWELPVSTTPNATTDASRQLGGVGPGRRRVSLSPSPVADACRHSASGSRARAPTVPPGVWPPGSPARSPSPDVPPGVWSPTPHRNAEATTMAQPSQKLVRPNGEGRGRRHRVSDHGTKSSRPRRRTEEARHSSRGLASDKDGAMMEARHSSRRLATSQRPASPERGMMDVRHSSRRLATSQRPASPERSGQRAAVAPRRPRSRGTEWPPSPKDPTKSTHRHHVSARHHGSPRRKRVRSRSVSERLRIALATAEHDKHKQARLKPRHHSPTPRPHSPTPRPRSRSPPRRVVLLRSPSRLAITNGAELRARRRSRSRSRPVAVLKPRSPDRPNLDRPLADREGGWLRPPLTRAPGGRQVHLPGVVGNDDGLQRWLQDHADECLQRLGPGALDCVDVTHNNLTDEGATALVDFLLRRRQPTCRLKLFHNKIRDSTAICDLIEDDRCGIGAPDGLVELHLSHNLITVSMLDRLLDSIGHRVAACGGRLRRPFYLRLDNNPMLVERNEENFDKDNRSRDFKSCFNAGYAQSGCSVGHCRHGADVHIVFEVRKGVAGKGSGK